MAERDRSALPVLAKDGWLEQEHRADSGRDGAVVYATIADVIVEERKAWKQAYNAFTTDYHTFKTDAEKWSKVFVKEMAELRVEVHQLSGQLVEAKTEVKRLEEENSKLIVKGTLSKSPRKVKVD